MSDEAAVAEFSAETKEMGDKIAEMTLKQAKELSDYLKDVHGIEPAAGGGAVMVAAGGAGGDLVTALVDDLYVPPRNGDGRRAVPHRKMLDSEAVGADRPPGFGLPPMVDYRNVELRLCPLECIWIGALAGQEQRAQRAQVVFSEQ